MIRLIQGDITTVGADAIVNAANNALTDGSGVNGAIHRAGGPEIMRACEEIRRKQGGCPTGSAVLTGAGSLPARYVIHTVGPVWMGGDQNEARMLASAYRSSLDLAWRHGLRRVAFPGISTGVFGYPKRQAAEIAVRTIGEFLAGHEGMEVILVSFNQEQQAIYEELLH